MKKYFLKVGAVVASVILAGTTIASPLSVTAAPRAADELLEQIELPMSIMDYHADNLLFQYDLGDTIGKEFALTGAALEAVDGTAREGIVMTGLVETELSEDGFPVYRKEVVEAIAKLVQQQLSLPPNSNTTSYFQNLKNKLATNTDGVKNAIRITNDMNGRLTTNYFFKEGTDDEIGWKPVGMDGYSTSGRDLQDADGRSVWAHADGIWHLVDGRHQLSKNISGLDAALTYTLAGKFQGTSMEVQVTDTAGNVIATLTDPAGDQSTKEITFSGLSEANLILTADGAGCHLNELTLSEGGNTRNFVTREATGGFTNSGWYPMADFALTEVGTTQLQDEEGVVRWELDGDGLVNHGDSSQVYTDIEVNSGSKYLVSYNSDSGKSLHVWIYDGTDGTVVLADGVENGAYITPSQSTIRVVVQGTGDPTKTDWTQNKLVNLSIAQMTSVLGSYEESALKYDDTDNGYDSITTCMDYAYFMLNNLFNPDADSNSPYGEFKKIVLDQLTEGEEDYGFFADVSGLASKQGAKVYLDYDKDEIRNDETLGTYQGLFPLDNAESFLESEKNMYMDSQSTYRNFHYGIRSHATFYYEESADLYFDFVGDDDVYLFINGKLAMDIGGAHTAAHNHIKINDLKDWLGLENGKCYNFDFFYMERCTSFSNLAIETNIKLLEAGTVDLQLYNKDALLPDEGSTVDYGSTVELVYDFRANENNVTSINFTDSTLGVVIGTGGLSLGDKVVMGEDGITVTITRSNGDEVIRRFTSEDELKAYFTNEVVLNANDKIVVSGMNYIADDKLDADLVVTYTAPNYAGIGGGTAVGTDGDAGSVGVGPAPDPKPDPDPDPKPDPDPDPKPDPDPEPKPDPKPTPKPPVKEDTPVTTSVVTTPVSTPVVVSSVPKTGDETLVALYVAGIIFGLAGIGVVLFLKKKDMQA